jgi:MFS family permease
MPATEPLPSFSNRGRWLALTAALLGWMFDGLEMGLFPLVARPALRDLLGTTDETLISRWFAVVTAMFLIGAATGGVVFGWLGDRLGRVRAMMLSILTYAIFSGACGLANEAWQVALFRFIAALGMGGEWSLGVALVMEVWPNRSRALLAGVIGAAANFGYLLIAVAGLGLNAVIGDMHALLKAIGLSDDLSAKLVAHSGWRILMLCGVLPAILTLLIQLFVPESHKWQEEKRRGSTSHWDPADLLGVVIGAAAACGMIALWAIDLSWTVRIGGSVAAIAIVTIGYLYPMRRYLQRMRASSDRPSSGRQTDAATIRRMLLAAGLSGVALLGTWGSTQWAPVWVDKLTGGTMPNAKSYTLMCTSSGAIVGCVLAALAGDWLGRRMTYFLLCAASLGSVFGLFLLNTEYGAALLVWAFVAGAITAAFYGWLPLYLPELFTTRVRATGQGFGFNFGRIIAAVGVLQLPVIMKELNVSYAQACPAMSLIYIVGMILIWFAPETKGKPLPED